MPSNNGRNGANGSGTGDRGDRPATSVEVRKANSVAATEITRILEPIDKAYWKEIIELAGIPTAILEAAAESIAPIDEDLDLDSLSQIALVAMKRGMSGDNPNAQMVRTFNEWQRDQLGMKQMQSVEVHIVPAEVPDNIVPQLTTIMKELRHLAATGNI